MAVKEVWEFIPHCWGALLPGFSSIPAMVKADPIVPTAKPTILVIDDEAINIRVVGEILVGSDYEVIFALNGPEGIRWARDIDPDLILLDVKMQGMDGYEVCARLQSAPRTAALSVVFVTALDSTAQEIQGLEAGAVDYLTKPLVPQVVKARIKSHLAMRRKLAGLAGPDAQGQAAAPVVSARQREILEWIQAGKTNDEIAAIIGSSKANVRYHIGQR